MLQQSQLAPLPNDLPFRIVSKTIGRGSYASIKKAIPLDAPQPVFAVKFIHKAFAVRHGRISAKQINMEVSLHAHVGRHKNIIEYFTTGEDSVWRWIAIEFAEGGDLFDKIEADVGVNEDIAHVYFKQLVSGVSFMHSKGVGHRDIKPENILLSSSGNLKLADFGLATLFSYKGHQKTCTTMCGSPPYTAPEVISCSRGATAKHGVGTSGYDASHVDIWSCGVVLFVLLVGNTPWDEPTPSSWEFSEYVKNNGRSTDELWEKLPPQALSLLRGMMKVDTGTRFTFEDVRRHPWFTRPNSYLNSDGDLRSPVSVAAKLLENLKIDFSQAPTTSQGAREDSMDIDMGDFVTKFASTQPETPINDIMFDWERPPRVAAHDRWSASQPVAPGAVNAGLTKSNDIWGRLSDEPSMSQFTAAPGVPLSLTQRAQRFEDIVPSYSLTRFYSHLPHNLLLPLLSESLQQLGMPTPPFTRSALQGHESAVWIKVKTLDGRHCPIVGDIVVDQTGVGGEREGEELLDVRFVKVKGDPLEWRRFFKKVVVLSKEGVYVPEGD
ncbi:MAG: Chk1 protein kinase [Piccolia ochrophora]|nr:MAG: Chk1 protein kinase [Piccolia ochrophora]